jgi:hypothetical protein
MAAEGFTHLLTMEAPSKKTDTLGLLFEGLGLKSLQGGDTRSHLLSQTIALPRLRPLLDGSWLR